MGDRDGADDHAADRVGALVPGGDGGGDFWGEVRGEGVEVCWIGAGFEGAGDEEGGSFEKEDLGESGVDCASLLTPRRGEDGESISGGSLGIEDHGWS